MNIKDIYFFVLLQCVGINVLLWLTIIISTQHGFVINIDFNHLGEGIFEVIFLGFTSIFGILGWHHFASNYYKQENRKQNCKNCRYYDEKKGFCNYYRDDVVMIFDNNCSVWVKKE